MKRFVFILSFVAAFALNGLSQNAKALPDIALKDINGNAVRMAQGKPALLVFWATWCNCTKALDQLNDEYSYLRSKYGLNIYSVAIDDSRSSAQVKPFVEQHNWDFVALADTEGRLKSSLNVTNPPHMLLFSGEGMLIWQQLGQSGDFIRTISDELERMKQE